MKIQRLFAMPPAEIAFRARQALSMTVDRVGNKNATRERMFSEIFYYLSDDTEDDVKPVSLFMRGFRANAVEVLHRNIKLHYPGRFFAGAADNSAADLINQHQVGVRQQTILVADAICRHEFPILGYGFLKFQRAGDSGVDWHLDPVNEQRSPRIHWSRLNPLDTNQVGDSKVVWELNRHQWLLPLGQAFQLTSDEKYAQACVRLLRDWMAHNPVGIGVNWTSSLEVAYRLISWCWALQLFTSSRAMTAEVFVNMMAWIRAHASHIERYLSVYYSPNTHLTGEALGLYYAGTLFPEFLHASRWRALGKRILEEQLERQVHPDGVHFEQSTRYQYYTIEIYLHFLILAQRNGDSVTPAFTRQVQSMIEFMVGVLRPDSTLPQIGDGDGGCLLPLQRREPGDISVLLSVAAVLFNRRDFAGAAGEQTADLLYLCGAESRRRLKTLRALPSPRLSSRIFREGGYVVIRGAESASAHQMIFDVGPLGCPDSGAHGHADMLSLQCSAFGENYLVDAGTFGYTADPFWRNYFRSTQAHSTLTIDGRSQLEPAGPFSWHAIRPCAVLRDSPPQAGIEIFDASHAAWSVSDDPIVHRRRVVFVREAYWIVVDDVTGSKPHLLQLRYQFDVLAVAQEAEGWVRARGNKNSSLLVRLLCNETFTTELASGAMMPPRGWISRNYGQRCAAPALTFELSGQLPVRLVSILFPTPGSDTTAPTVTANQSLTQLKICDPDGRTDYLLITEEFIKRTEIPESCVA